MTGVCYWPAEGRGGEDLPREKREITPINNWGYKGTRRLLKGRILTGFTVSTYRDSRFL